MNDVMMMDRHNIADNNGYYPHVDSINIMGENSSAGAMDVDDEEWVEEKEEKARPAAAAARSLGITELVRRQNEAAGIDTALRVMAHAGRILWKAAIDSLPAGGYSFHVLSKLFRKSYFPNSGSVNGSSLQQQQQQQPAILEEGGGQGDANASTAALTRDFIIDDGVDDGSSEIENNGITDGGNTGSNGKRNEQSPSPSFIYSALLPVATAMQPWSSAKRRAVEISEEDECYPLTCYEQKQQNHHRYPMKRIKLCS